MFTICTAQSICPKLLRRESLIYSFNFGNVAYMMMQISSFHPFKVQTLF